MTVCGRHVAVVGGGVSGLTAAHELSDRGFVVTVFEKDHDLGGKARSSSNSGLPAEHGFRFFPGFYTHVINTMCRIPTSDGKNVAKHLVELDTAWITARDGKRLVMPLPTSTSQPTWRQRLAGIRSFCGALPGVWESACFLSALVRLVVSCQARWDEQLERESWLDYAMPPARTRLRDENYRRLFAIGLTRSFVATRAEEMSARTGGRILLQLLYDTFAGPGERRAADRALDGPTSDVWIKPWQELLSKNGVTFKTQCKVDSLQVEATGPVRGLWLAGGTSEDQFDFYVLALPCERLKQLLAATPALVARDSQLRRVFNLQTRWMNGIVFGLNRELGPALPRGHVLCLDSEWALTLVDQSRIWAPEHLTEVSARWPTLLSVDISDWGSPGANIPPARWLQAGREQIAEEVWRQLQCHLPELADLPCPEFTLDADIEFDHSPQKLTGPPRLPLENDKARPVQAAKERTNTEPLLVNTAGSRADRPQAATALANLFIAGDHPRTFTDFASMEAANEAARRAVNALLDQAGHIGDRCEVWDLQHPCARWFRVPQRWACAVDAIIFRLGLPMRPPFRSALAASLVLGVGSRLRRISTSSSRPTSGASPTGPN